MAEKYSAYQDPDRPISRAEVLFHRILRYRLLLALAISGLLLDQFSKAWIANLLEFGSYHPPHRIEIIEGFFHLVHIGNEGAAWGILQGWSLFLAFFSLLCLLAIYFFRESLDLRRPPCQLAFGLLIGGILGNLIDRLFRGHVVDFLDFHLGSYVWPAFNVADILIFLGVATYLYYSFFLEQHYPPPKKKCRELTSK